MEVTTKSLAGRVRALREAEGISLRALAARAGLDPAQLSRIENARTLDPAWSSVCAIADALRVSLDDLAEPSGGRIELMCQLRRQARCVLGYDEQGKPVALRRDRGLAGGPHSLMIGEQASGLVQREAVARAAASLRTISLWPSAQAPEPWYAAGARLMPESRWQLISLDPNQPPDQQMGPLESWIEWARASGPLLITCPLYMIHWPQTGEMLRRVLLAGRAHQMALSLFTESSRVPSWVSANASQRLLMTQPETAQLVTGHARTRLLL